MTDPRPQPEARWSLPDDPSLEWLRKRAKKLRRDVAARDPEAVALAATYDGPAGPEPFSLSRAQRVLARAYGFASWARLRDRLALLEEYTRSPEPHASGQESSADRLLRLACLSYTRYDPADSTGAERLLAARPDLARSSVWTLAACGRASELAALLAADPSRVDTFGGPHRWPPLLYLTYARLDASAGDPVGTARVLVRAGADVNAGFLWRGLTSPFTALTGAFGGGERNESVHPDSVELARVLLEAGADPNDNQALYNRMFTSDDSHLEVLLDHGLGENRPSPWRDRLGDAYPGPGEMVGEQLRHAAEHGYLDRVRLLLEHGTDPNTVGYHPVLGDQTAYEIAVRNGHQEAARLLALAGGNAARLDDVDLFLASALAAERDAVTTSLAADEDLARRAVCRRPELVSVAVQQGHDEALPLLLELGFDIDGTARDRRTALHLAAVAGRAEVAGWLIAHGADRDRRDREFDATPAGWAEYGGHADLAARLSTDRG